MLKLFSPLWFISQCVFYWAGAATVAGSVVSGALSKSSGDSAAKGNKKAVAASNARLDKVAADTKQSFAPEINYGNAANSKLADYLGLDTGQNTTGATNGFTPLNYDQWAAGQAGNTQPSIRSGHQSLGGYVADTWNNPTSSIGGGATQEGYQKYLAANPAMAASSGTTMPHSPNFGSLLHNFDNNDFVADPGYQFRLDEGTKGIDRSAAARGGYDSGATLKALARYNQDYASSEFSNASNRDSANKSRIYDFLSGVENRGANAKDTVASTAVGVANNAGNNSINGANTQGNYQVNGAAGLNNSIQGGIGNYLYNQQMQRPFNASVVGGNTGMTSGYNAGTNSFYA